MPRIWFRNSTKFNFMLFSWYPRPVKLKTMLVRDRTRSGSPPVGCRPKSPSGPIYAHYLGSSSLPSLPMFFSLPRNFNHSIHSSLTNSSFPSVSFNLPAPLFQSFSTLACSLSLLHYLVTLFPLKWIPASQCSCNSPSSEMNSRISMFLTNLLSYILSSLLNHVPSHPLR